MNTAIAQAENGATPTEKVKAVIISGPQTGEIVMLGEIVEPQWSPAEEAALEVTLRAMQSAAKSAQEAVETARHLNRKLDYIHRRLHDGRAGHDSRNGQVSDHDRSAVEAVA